MTCEINFQLQLLLLLAYLIIFLILNFDEIHNT